MSQNSRDLILTFKLKVIKEKQMLLKKNKYYYKKQKHCF